ncbi:signal peptidase I [Rubritalea profundi]|uniref:Signal peptidase I n=1 Tax=Rubritalea profundi TaxID=1658618 RepID=A0A2S7TY85_9BACT|nr:signal peptidase I [Rubritalea profundi]PQJ27207.1 signal peptidase I [Rubritalea profundi]
MFTPKWKKEAKHLYKGAKKFINYKRDLLVQDRIDEIESRRVDLQKACKSSNKEEASEAGKQLQACCEQALSRYKAPDAVAENVEVLFVAIVVALGLRAYYLQPFRIPTGSMRPTLNGIIGHVESKDKWPALPVRLMQEASHGRSYLSIVNDTEGDRIVSIEQKQQFHFFTRTVITFASGRSQNVSGSTTAFLEVLNKEGLQKIVGGQLSPNPAQMLQQLQPIKLPAGFVVAEGYIETGDLVLVDKFSYHFRAPDAGEVFVFDTREIKQIQAGENPGSHYIKRLIATPGQKIELKEGTARTLSYQKPNGQIGVMQVNDQALVYIDGEKLQAPGVLRVEAAANGYGGYQATARLAPGRYVKLADKPSTGKSEYWAQGDNSYNSSDSRMWGTVKEFNLVGPAMIALWPFGSGHWGFID